MGAFLAVLDKLITLFVYKDTIYKKRNKGYTFGYSKFTNKKGHSG